MESAEEIYVLDSGELVEVTKRGEENPVVPVAKSSCKTPTFPERSQTCTNPLSNYAKWLFQMQTSEGARALNKSMWKSEKCSRRPASKRKLEDDSVQNKNVGSVQVKATEVINLVSPSQDKSPEPSTTYLSDTSDDPPPPKSVRLGSTNLPCPFNSEPARQNEAAIQRIFHSLTQRVVPVTILQPANKASKPTSNEEFTMSIDLEMESQSKGAFKATISKSAELISYCGTVERNLAVDLSQPEKNSKADGFCIPADFATPLSINITERSYVEKKHQKQKSRSPTPTTENERDDKENEADEYDDLEYPIQVEENLEVLPSSTLHRFLATKYTLQIGYPCFANKLLCYKCKLSGSLSYAVPIRVLYEHVPDQMRDVLQLFSQTRSTHMYRNGVVNNTHGIYYRFEDYHRILKMHSAALKAAEEKDGETDAMNDSDLKENSSPSGAIYSLPPPPVDAVLQLLPLIPAASLDQQPQNKASPSTNFPVSREKSSTLASPSFDSAAEPAPPSAVLSEKRRQPPACSTRKRSLAVSSPNQTVLHGPNPATTASMVSLSQLDLMSRKLAKKHLNEDYNSMASPSQHDQMARKLARKHLNEDHN